jgi:chloramphenicol O-acetyltransferase type A
MEDGGGIMRVIDQQNWPRLSHFQLYRGFEFPHVNICVQLDITELWANRPLVGASPTVTLIYVVTKAANRIPEFRQRIRGDQVVQHEMVHPLVTVLGDNDLFGVVTLPYHAHFETFASNASEILAQAKQGVSMDEFPHDQEGKFGRDDLLSITLLPWLAFTSFAIARKPSVDSIPLLAIGKVHKNDERYLLPFYVNFHHALVDGLHAARLVKHIEEEACELIGNYT